MSELKQVYTCKTPFGAKAKTNLNFHHPLHQCNAKQWAFCWGGAETVILWCAHCKRLYLYLYHAWTCTPWIIITSAVRGGWFAKVWRIDTTESNQGIALSVSKKPLCILWHNLCFAFSSLLLPLSQQHVIDWSGVCVWWRKSFRKVKKKFSSSMLVIDLKPSWKVTV